MLLMPSYGTRGRLPLGRVGKNKNTRVKSERRGVIGAVTLGAHRVSQTYGIGIGDVEIAVSFYYVSLSKSFVKTLVEFWNILRILFMMGRSFF